MDLPPEVVRLVDDLYCGVDPADALALAEDWRARSIRTLDREAGVFVSTADESALENARYLLERLRFPVAGGEPAARKVMTDVAELVPMLRRVSRNRLRVWFVDAEPLDALLVAGVAVAQGRGQAEAVVRRLSPAALYMRDLYEHFRQRAPSLPDSVREEVRHGFDRVTDGLELLGTWLTDGRKETLERALCALRAGCEAVSQVERWRAAGERTRAAVPVGGEPLGALLDAARCGDADRAARAARFREVWMPRLYGLLEQFRQELPLNLETRDVLLEELGEALGALDGTLESSDATELESVVKQLEQAFASLRGGVVRVEQIGDARLQEMARLISGVWFGTVPLLGLLTRMPELMRDDDADEIEEAARHLDYYLQTGERFHVQAALD
ncbi:MAG: hypothetical protein FJX76_00240 [Armatimonadetes bacterium]|nr:hypothetical protein [Armatimonadota bacterium]